MYGSVPKGGAGTPLIDKATTRTNDVPDAAHDRAGPRVLTERKWRIHRPERPRYESPGPKARRGEARTCKRSERKANKWTPNLFLSWAVAEKQIVYIRILCYNASTRHS